MAEKNLEFNRIVDRKNTHSLKYDMAHRFGKPETVLPLWVADIDFERYPEQHCIKAPELLRAASVSEDIIHAVCSHGYELTVDIKPEHEMEKVLYAVDELTGLIGATALMRPSKSVQDMEVKSVKKKYKSANFAAGCSREVIERGAGMLGYELNDLMQKTIYAMRSCEEEISTALRENGLV